MTLITSLVFLGSFVGILAIVSYDKMRELDCEFDELDALYRKSLKEQDRLEFSFNTGDDLMFCAAYEQLEAFTADALRNLRVDDDGSECSLIVKDMFFCNMTPEETYARVMKFRQMNKRNSSISPVYHRRACDRR